MFFNNLNRVLFELIIHRNFVLKILKIILNDEHYINYFLDSTKIIP